MNGVQSRTSRLSTFWKVLLVIFAAAAIVRLLSFAAGLPYISQVDEPNFYWKAMSWRGLFDRGGLEGYPPLIIVLNIGMQLITERLGQAGPSATIFGLRLLAVGYSLFVLLFVALTARAIGGDLAGLVAATAWAISPTIIQFSTTALADPVDFLFVGAALWTAVVALQDPNRQHWCIWSVIFGLLAILAKYPVFPAIIPGGLVALTVLFRDRRKGLIYLSIQAALVLSVAVWTFVIYQAQRFDYNYPPLKSDLGARVSYFIRGLIHAAAPVNALMVGFVCVLAILAFLVASRVGLERLKIGPLALALTLMLSLIFVASLFTPIDGDLRERDIWPATSTVCIILSVGIAQISWAIPKRWGTYARWLPTVALSAVLFLPQLLATTAYVQQAQLEDVRVAVRHWADINLDPGTFLVGGENTRLFNPYYGGITGRKWFDWWVTHNILEHSIADWRDVRHIPYAAISLFQLNIIKSTQAGRDYIAQMLHIRDFVPPPTRYGEPIIIYSLHKMDVQTNIQFGDRIILTGYDRSTEQASPGDTLRLRFYWQAKARPASNYSVYIHVTTTTDRQPIAQADGSPAHAERPAVTWDDPNETLLSEEMTLKLPPSLVPGQYRILVGVYDYQNGQRLLTTTGQDYVLLYTLTIKPLLFIF